jgi:hypothetical protein
VVPVAAAGLGAALGDPVPGPLVWAGISLVAVGLVLGVSAGPVHRGAAVAVQAAGRTSASAGAAACLPPVGAGATSGRAC